MFSDFLKLISNQNDNPPLVPVLIVLNAVAVLFVVFPLALVGAWCLFFVGGGSNYFYEQDRFKLSIWI